jgi:hydroxymethylpyrimidine pyrophosphatase-like HAD family hydrolase
MIIAVDFDGTCVTHEYPKVGKDIGAEKVLKKLLDNSHQLILYTMRSGASLDEAKKWFEDKGISLYSIGFNPTQHSWTKSNKCFANLYIDDATLGIPLISSEGRPYVDWDTVEKMLIDKGIIKGEPKKPMKDESIKG